MLNRRLSRRQALQAGGLLVLGTMGVAACGDDSSGGASTSSGSGKVLVGTWGGDYTEAQERAYFKPFTRKTGIEVVPVAVGNLNAAAIKAFQATGNYQWDVADISAEEYQIAVDNGWLEPIDYDVVRAADKTPDSQFLEYGVAAESITEVLVYRDDVFRGAGPSSWADMWDTERFPGPRGMWKNPYPTLEVALLADGVAPDQLYPLDVERALKKLDELKDDIVWWESGAQSQQLIADKNIVLGVMWSGRAAQSKLVDDVPLTIVWDEGVYTPSIYVVPRGAPNAGNAMKLIDYMAGAKQLATFAELTYYGPTNLKSLPYIEPATRALTNTNRKNRAAQFERDHAYWAENLNQLSEQFTTWLTA